MIHSLLSLGLLLTPVAQEPSPTRVLVLATPHLEGVAGFERGMLEPLLEVLEGWGPDAICVEALPGRAIESLLADRASYGPVLDQFVGRLLEHGRWAQDELGVDRAGAAALLREAEPERAALDRTLEALAAYELPAALLHWSAWRDEEPTAGAGTAYAAWLDGWLRARNEIASLALPLARRLGHGRLHAIDDHLDKDAFLRIAGALTRELEGHPELEAVARAPVYRASAEDLSAALELGDLLPHYLHLNGDAFGSADVDAQWGVFLRTRLPSGLDRARLALWDVRNLGIAANVRRVSADHPGGRVLVLIGAGHRPFLEQLLQPLLDVEVVRLGELVE